MINRTGSEPGTIYPTRAELRAAFTARGLTPPPLLQWRRLIDTSESETSEGELFSQLSTAVGAASREQESLHPDDLLDDSEVRGKLSTNADAVAQHIDSAASDVLREALQGLAAYTMPVLMRMPARSVEDRERRRSAAQSIIFASSLNPTRTLFMVNMENEGSLTFRLHHRLIERLQQACEDLIRMLSEPIIIAKGVAVSIQFQSPIEIYEVGQEDSTILGEVVGTSFGPRWRYALRKDRVSYVAVTVLALLFLVLLATLLQQHLHAGHPRLYIGTSGGRTYIDQPDNFWLGQAERLQSGVIPVLLVTLLTLIIRFPRGVIISWSQRYGGRDVS
jgi:hypothetical protein